MKLRIMKQALTRTPFMKIVKNTRISFNEFVPLNLVCTPTYRFHLRILIVWADLQETRIMLFYYLTSGKKFTTDTLMILAYTYIPSNLEFQGLTELSCITGMDQGRLQAWIRVDYRFVGCIYVGCTDLVYTQGSD